MPVNLSRHRPIERSRGLPLPARLLLGFSVVLLGVVILWASTGQLGHVVADFGGALSGMVSRIAASPTPVAAIVPVYPPPSLIVPEESYTNVPSVDLHGLTDAGVAGRTDFKIRIYQILGVETNPPALVREIPVAAIPQFTVPGVTLEKGIDFFTATLIGPDGHETAASKPVRYVYDTSKPKINLSSPKDGATINAATVDIVGTGPVAEQRRRPQRGQRNVEERQPPARPATSAFRCPSSPEPNGLTLTSTDPAGNESQLVISVLRGDGKLAATLTPSSNQYPSTKLPSPLTLTAIVTDPDGHPVDGASVTFTLSIPGIDPVTFDATTDATGHAIFQTTVPNGATVGNGLATILVDTKDFGTVSSASRDRHREVGSRRVDRRPARSYDGPDADVAVPTLWSSAARGRALLGLPTLHHRLPHLPAVPTVGRREPRLLRPRPEPQAPLRRRDPAVLGTARGRGRPAGGRDGVSPPLPPDGELAVGRPGAVSGR